MKKVLAVSAFALVGLVVLSSCKKDYTCTYDNGSGTDTVLTYEGLSKAEAESAESGCKFLSGTWATK